MPWVPAASPHGPVISPRPFTVRVTVAVAVVVAAGALAACGSSRAGTGTSAAEKPDLTVAAVPASGAAGLYIAQQDGLFTAAGLHVKIVPVASGGDVLASLVNGSVDVDEGQWTSAIADHLHPMRPGLHLRHVLPGRPGPHLRPLRRRSGSPARTGPVMCDRPGTRHAGYAELAAKPSLTCWPTPRRPLHRTSIRPRHGPSRSR